MVALAAVALRATTPSSAAGSDPVPARTGTTSCRPSRPVVSVPVLSVQTTSTLLSASTALSCCTSAPCLTSAAAPTAYDTLTRKNSPYGTSPDSTADVCTTRSSDSPSSAACSRIAALISATSTMTARTTRSMRACSGVRVGVHVRAAAVSFAAELAAPTASARCSAVPVRQAVPDSARSPAVLTTGSDSPVSSDSSSSRRPGPTTGPSTTTWSPAVSRSRSPCTTCSGSTSRSCPSRTTRQRARCSRRSRSRVRLARSSCAELMTALSRPRPTLTTASLVRPSASSATPMTNRRLLKKVKRFARRIDV